MLNVSTLRDLRKIGHITPSSNTALEPLTALMNAPLADRISHHFSRVQVRRMNLSADSASQFDTAPMLAAAKLLADAPLDGLVWNGTSASWLGRARDVELCRQITDATGIAASTSTLAFMELFEAMGWSKIALAVPYEEDLTSRICDNYAREGFDIVGRAALGTCVNIEVGNTPYDRIRDILRASDHDSADCIAVVCTNWPATHLVEELEAELGKPIIDSISLTWWKSCMMAGIRPDLQGWGQLVAGKLV